MLEAKRSLAGHICAGHRSWGQRKFNFLANSARWMNANIEIDFLIRQNFSCTFREVIHIQNIFQRKWVVNIRLVVKKVKSAVRMRINFLCLSSSLKNSVF